MKFLNKGQSTDISLHFLFLRVILVLIPMTFCTSAGEFVLWSSASFVFYLVLHLSFGLVVLLELIQQLSDQVKFFIML